jgi:hypothetical protein
MTRIQELESALIKAHAALMDEVSWCQENDYEVSEYSIEAIEKIRTVIPGLPSFVQIGQKEGA